MQLHKYVARVLHCCFTAALLAGPNGELFPNDFIIYSCFEARKECVCLFKINLLLAFTIIISDKGSTFHGQQPLTPSLGETQNYQEALLVDITMKSHEQHIVNPNHSTPPSKLTKYNILIFNSPLWNSFSNYFIDLRGSVVIEYHTTSKGISRSILAEKLPYFLNLFE